MKMVITADVHLHPYRICSRDGGHDRLMDGLSVLRQSLDLAREHGATWVMAGDFKQPKTFWPQSALTGALALLREYEADGLEMVMLAGNHDAWGEGGSGLSPFADVAHVVDRPEVVALRDGGRLRCLPWDAEPGALADTGLPLVSHAFLQGIVLGPEDVHPGGKGVPIEDYGDFPFAVFGDIHKGQWREFVTPGCGWVTYESHARANEPDERWDGGVRVPAPWAGEVFYPGSPYMQNWGERNDGPKGSLLVDTETGQVDLHEHAAPRFVHVELDDAGLERWLPRLGELAGDFLRVVYTGTGSMVLGALEHRAESFRHFQLVRRPPAAPAQRRAEIHAGLDRSEILDRYLAARPPTADLARTRAAGRRLFLEAAE
jgi:hypothetical protein